MPSLMDEIVGAGNAPPDPRFPHAPAGWSEAAGAEAARREGLEPGAEHWGSMAPC
jgi:hypothetical protein